MNKSVVVTIRFNPKELQELSRYLRRNTYFDSLSSLGRVATLEFVRTKTTLSLQPGAGRGAHQRPWFLWDYDLTEAQVHELLTHAPFEQRKWLLGRMVERLGPVELMQYISLKTLQEALPRLRVAEKVKRHWEEAIALWISPRPTS